MKWEKLLIGLAKKLPPVLAYPVLIIIIVALLGSRIPQVWQVALIALTFTALVVYSVGLLLDKFPSIPRTVPGPKHDPKTEANTPSTAEPSDPKKIIGGHDDPPPPSLETARRTYLEAMAETCQRMRLVGFDPQASDPERRGLSLQSVYIDLETQTPVAEEETGKRKKNDEADEIARIRGERRQLTALEALADGKERRMVLLGLPGSGKSTFVRYLTLRLAQALLDRSQDLGVLLPGWKGGAVTPFIVPLGLLAESLPPGVKTGTAEMIETLPGRPPPG